MLHQIIKAHPKVCRNSALNFISAKERIGCSLETVRSAFFRPPRAVTKKVQCSRLRSPERLSRLSGGFDELFCLKAKKSVPLLHQIIKAHPKVCLYYLVETTGIEPVTPCMSSKYSNQLSYASKAYLFYYTGVEMSTPVLKKL